MRCCPITPSLASTPRSWKLLAGLSLACLALAVAGAVGRSSGLPISATVALFLCSYAAGAWNAAHEAWQRIRQGEIEIHFLMLAVALGAAVIGEWGEGALLLFLFSAAGAMEEYASDRNRREVGSLLRGTPKTATVLSRDAEADCPVEQLESGMKIRVRPGELVPADLRVERGESACDESNLTGESRPVAKQIGDVALAGTLNTWGVIDGEVFRPASESALQKIIRLIETAQQLKAPSQRFTDRFGTGYTYFVLVICAAFFVYAVAMGAPAFFGSFQRESAFYRAMTLLVVLSPCALVLSVPAAILSAIAAGARRGVLFRGGAAIESLADVSIVALDKTGTLTRGEPTLVRVEISVGDETTLLTTAYNLARLSHHPLSRAIQKLGAQRGLARLEYSHLESVPGRGVEAEHDGFRFALGSRHFIQETLGNDCSSRPASTEPDVAEVWVAGPNFCGRLLFRDDLRVDADVFIQKLRRTGIRTLMLTGDIDSIAQAVGRRAGIDEVRSGLSPADKVTALQSLKTDGRKIAMIGDGVNDAPSLAAADVGIGMGARASDAALEQADVVLMDDRLESFMIALSLSKTARKIVRQNIIIALGTVLLMGLVTVVKGIPLSVGVLAHEGSTVIVLLNGLRLLLERTRSL